MQLDILQKLTTYDGMPLIIDDKKILIKDILLQYTGGYQAKDGKESIMAFAIGQKIYSCEEGEVELTPEEFLLLEKTLEPPKHIALVMGPLLNWMEEQKNGNEKNGNENTENK